MRSALALSEHALSGLQDRHASLQAEMDDLKPHVAELLRESEEAHAREDSLEALRGQLHACRQRAETAEEALADCEGLHRGALDAAAARGAELQARCAAKEVRLKEILAQAAEKIKILEAQAAKAQEKQQRLDEEARAARRMEVSELQNKVVHETRAHDQVLAAARHEKARSTEAEAALARQLQGAVQDSARLADRLREAEAAAGAHKLEADKQCKALEVRLAQAEVQASYWERQAAACADEARRLGEEAASHRGASRELGGDLKMARRQYEALAAARQKDQAAFAEDMEQQRALAHAQLASRCAALAGEGEAALMEVTRRLWQQEQAAEAQGQAAQQALAKLHLAQDQQALLREQLVRAQAASAQQQQQHAAAVTRAKAEHARATAEQLQEQQCAHSAELAETTRALSLQAERIMAELQSRCAALEAALAPLEQERARSHALSIELCVLQQARDEATAQGSAWQAELGRLAREHGDEVAALRRRLDEAHSSAQREREGPNPNPTPNPAPSERQSAQLQRVRERLEGQVGL